MTYRVIEEFDYWIVCHYKWCLKTRSVKEIYIGFWGYILDLSETEGEWGGKNFSAGFC